MGPATPPEPTRSSGRPRPGTIRLPASIDRRDVPELVARCMEAVIQWSGASAELPDDMTMLVVRRL